MSIEILGTEIEKLTLKPTITGRENIPTGGEGLYRITTEQVRDYILAHFAKDSINLGNVDNTSDENKPLSKAVRDALQNVIVKGRDPLVTSVNTFTGDVVLTAEHLGLGNVNNTADLDKPLSKADIAALFLKLDKATFNEFEDIFQRFHDKVESKLSDLDAITKTTFSLATSNEERIFQLEKDLEELRDYLDAEIHRVHHSLSNTQVDLILQLISDTFDNNLYHSLYFESVIESLKTYSDTKLDLVYLEIAHLKEVDQQLDDKIKQLGSNINSAITEVRNELSDLNIDIDQQYVRLNNLIEEAKDYIDDQIATVPVMIAEFKTETTKMLKGLKDEVAGIITSLDNKVNNVSSSIDDKIRENNSVYIKDLYNSAEKNAQDLIQKTEDSFTQSLNELDNQVNAFKNESKSIIDTITAKADEREAELKGLIETQISYLDIVVKDRLKDTEKLIDDLNLSVEQSIRDTNQTLANTKAQLDAESAAIKAEIAQERIDRDNAIKVAVDAAIADIQHQLENIDIPAIHELSQKIDDLNLKIEDGAAFLSDEVIAYINSGINNLDTKLQTDLQNLTNNTTLEQIDRLGRITSLEDGLTQEKLNRKDGDDKLLSNIENYKLSNNQALANVQTGIQVTVAEAVSSSSKWTEIDNRFTTIESDTGTLSDSVTSVTQKVNSIAQENESIADSVDSLTTTVNTNDSTVKGLIAEEASSRTTDVETINRRINTMQSDYDSLSGTGKNLLLKSNVELKRLAQTDKLGEYKNGDATTGSTLVDYTLIFSLTKKPDINALAISLDNNTPISFEEKVTADAYKNIVHTIKFKALPTFDKVIFKETPISSTEYSVIHWAVLTKGNAIPVTDWIESPFDTESERVKTNAAITQLEQTSASANEALSLRINQNKTSIENADRKIDAEITTVNQTITTLESNTSTRLDRIRSDYQTADSTLNAAILQETTARTDENKALVDRIEAIRSSFSSGTNLVPFIYTDPIDVLSLTTSNANLVTVPVLPENLSKFFYTRYYWNLNPITSNTECFVQYRSGAEWNIQLQKSKKHIISVYLKHNSATNVNVTLRLNTESGQVLEGIVSVIPSSSFERYFVIIETPAKDTLGYLSIVFSGQPSTTILSISRLMVEQKDIEPSVWTSGTIASTSTYVNKISTLNNNQVALAERFENLSSEFQTSDSTLRGLIVQESEIRSTADESLSRKVDSVQASFDNSVFGGQNFWEFNSNGVVDIGTGSIESINNNVQHQKVTISSLSPTQSFKSRWTNLKVQQSPILDLAVPVSLSFDVFTSKLSKIRIDCDTWEANSGSSKLLDVVPGKWNRVSFDNIVSATLSGSDNYVGRLLLSINASEVETPVNDILGSFIEIRNIQLQQGTKSTGFVPPIVTLQNELIKTNAAITTESDTRASQNLAIASRVDGVTADIVNSENRSNAKILTEEQARVEGDRVLTERIEHLESTTDQISVGGANLIPFSYMFKKGTSSNPGVVVDINSDNKLTIQATDSQALSVTISNYMHDTSTTDYALTNVSNTGIVTVIMSYWVKRNNSSQPFIKHPEARLNSSTPFVEPFFVRGSPLYPNAYQLSYKFTSTTEVGFTSLAPALRTRGSELASALTIDRWKLELGQLATDWTDFKESTIEIEKRTQASISTIQKTISDNNEAMTSEINKATSLISDLPNQGINLLPYLTTVPKDVSFFKKTGLVDFVFNNTVAFAPYNGINVTTKDANLSTIILNSSSNPFNIVLKQGRYLFSIDASSTTSGHTISVDLAPVRGTSGSIIKGASVALTTTLKSYSFLFTIPVDGMYDVVINVNNPKVINRLMSFTKPILEQQVGTNLKASPFKEGLVDSAYSLLPISASESNIISQLETTTSEGKATAKLVTDLKATVQAEDTKVQGQIVTISQSISTLEGNTSTQINQMTSKFEKDMLRSSENLVSLKNISATSNGKVTVSTDRSFFTFSKVSSDSYFNIPVDFSQLQVGTRLTFSFNARSNYVLKDILLSQSSLLKVVKVLVGDVEQTSITNSKIIFNSSLAVNKFHPITILFEVLTLNSGVVQLGTSFNSTDKTFNTEIQYSMLSIGSKGIGWRLSAEDSEIYKLYTDAQITQYSQTVADEFKSVAETQNSMQTAMAQDRIKAETDIATVNKTISDMDEAYAQQFTTINTKFTNYQGSGNNLLNYEISVLDKVGMFANSIGLELSRIEQVNTDYNNMVFKTIGTRNSFTLRLDLGENYSTLSDVLFSLYLSNKVVPLKVSINTVESTVSASSVDNRLKGKPTNNPYIELVITTVDGSNIQPGVDIFSISRLMVEQVTNGTPSTWTAGNKGIGSVVESSALELRESISNTQETFNRRIDSMESSFNGRIAGGGNLWTVTDKSVNVTTITGNALVTVVDSTIEYFTIKSNVAQTNLAVKIEKINVVPNQQIVPETSYSLSFKIKSTANTTVKIDVINNTSVGYQSEIISLTPNTKLVNVSMKFTGTTVDETSIKFTFPSIALNNTVSISEVMFQEGNTTQFTKSVPFIEKAVSSTNANIEDHKKTYATDKEASATRLNQMSAEYKSSGGSILIDNTTSNPSSWFSSGKANLKDNFVTSIDAPSGYSMFTKTTSVADNNLNDVYNLTTVPSGKAYRATIWIKCMPGSLGKCYLITGTRNSTDPSAPIVRQQFIDVTPVADGNWYNVGGVFSPSPINTPQKYFGFRLNVDGASTGGQVFAQGYTVSSVISNVDIDGSVATKANVDELTTVVTNANTASAEKITKLQSDLSNVDTKAGTAITNAAAAQQTANTAVTNDKATAERVDSLTTTVANNNTTVTGKINDVATSVTTLEGNTNSKISSLESSLSIISSVITISSAIDILKDLTITNESPGEITKIVNSTATGGQVLSIGNNESNDCVWARSTQVLTIETNRMYRLRARLRVTAGTTGTIYLGVGCLTADKASYVNTYNSLDSSLGSSNYLLGGERPPIDTWMTYEYFLQGKSTGTVTGSGTIQDPRTFAPLAAFASPMFIVNYPSASGTVEIDYITLEIADDLKETRGTSSALASLTTQVNTVDGNVVTLSNDLTTLKGATTALENNVAKKLDATIINDYFTKTESTSAIAGELTQFKTGLSIGGSNLLTNTKTFNKEGTVELAKTTFRPNYASFGTAFVTDPDSMLWRTHTVIQVRSDWCGFYYSCNSDNPVDWIADQDMTLSVWVKNISNATVNAHGIAPALGHVASIPSGEWQRIVMPIEKGRALRNTANQGLIEFNFTSTEGAFYYAAPMLQYGNVATAWQPSALDSDFDATQFASATYVQNIESNVTTIDGRVTANTNSLANLNVRVDNTQADLVNNYYTKSAANEATSGQLITMRSQLAYGARNFVRNTGAVFAGWYWMFQQPLTTKLQGEVTISFDVEVLSVGGNTGAGVGFSMGDNGTSGYNYVWYPDFTHSGHFSHTLMVNSENFTHFGIYANNEIRITKVMVQLGKVEFPWSPAPEDLSVAVSANAIAIQNTYTKTEANTATAGQIATFEASLALGGGILDVGRSKVIKTFEFGSGTITVTERKSNSFKIDVTNNGLMSAYISLATNSEKLPIGTSYVFTGKVRTSRTGAVDLIYSRINQSTSESYIYGEVGTEWQTFTAKGVTNTSEGDPLHSIIGAKMPAAIVGDWVEFKDCRVSVNTDEMTIANANSIQAVVNEVSEIEGNLQVLSQKTEKFSASIANAKLPTIINEDRVNQWHLTVVVPHKTLVGAPTYEHLDGATFVDERYVYDDALTLSNVDHSALYFRAIVYCDTARTITGILLGDDAHAVYVEGIKVFESGGYASNNISFSLPAGLSTIDMIASNGGGAGGFSLTPLLSNQVTWLKAVKSQGKDNADAIRSIGSSITNIDGRVTANANQTTSLQAKLDQRKIYRLYSGGADAATGGVGFIQGFNPDSMHGIGRSYGLVIFAGDGSIQSVSTYDVFGGHVQPFIDAVASVPVGTWVAVITTDEPNGNSALIIDSLKSLGGTDAVKQTVYRSAYLLVGCKGLSEGSAVELVSSKQSMGCTYMLELFNGVPTSMGGTSPQAGIVSQMRSEVTTLNGKVQSVSETTTLHEASLAIVNRKSISKEHGVDLRGMDSNMYYPVGAYITTDSPSYFEVVRTLGSFPEKPEWASHGIGFVCQCLWSVTGHGWGTSNINRVITDFKNAWTVSGQSALLGPQQLGNSSFEFVWLRGGAQYKFFTSGNINNLIVVTSETVYAYQTIAPIHYDASLVPQSTLGATAVALDQVRAQVTNNNGVVNAISEKVGTLETKVSGHSAKIEETNSTVDGIKVLKTVAVNNNGVLSGYGLVSELVNGQVTSAFGINADQFYVGAPSNGKKPFIVLSSPGVINGVTVPAGTYIDSAWIGQATIKSAQIDTLHGNKIIANSISASKMIIGDMTNLWTNRYFDPVGDPISFENGSGFRNEIINELNGKGFILRGRDHIATNVPIPCKEGDVIVMEYVAGQNSGPTRTLNCGGWLIKADKNYQPQPWWFGPATMIQDLGAGWYRWRRTFIIHRGGGTLPTCYFYPYFQIEQVPGESNPAQWTIGDLQIRKANGGELIVDGSITASKMQINELSAISANLGSIKVGTANIADLSVDTLHIKDRAITTPITLSKPAYDLTTTGSGAYTYISDNWYTATLTGLMPNGDVLIFLRGLFSAASRVTSYYHPNKFRLSIRLVLAANGVDIKNLYKLSDAYNDSSGAYETNVTTAFGSSDFPIVELVKADSSGNITITVRSEHWSNYGDYAFYRSHSDIILHALELKK